MIFSSRAWNWTEHKYPTGLYDSLLEDFQKLLKETGLSERKEDGVFKRRKISFHSFRRFVKTTIANQTRNSDYSEWFLGHTKSPYWVNKPGERKKIYKEDCMKYLSFLSYHTVQDIARNTDAELKALRKEKDEQNAKQALEIEDLKHQLQERTVDKQDYENLKKQLDAINKRLGIT